MTFPILAALAAGAALTMAAPDLPRPLIDEFDRLSVASANNAALTTAERLADEARPQQDTQALRQLRRWSDAGNLWARIALARLIEEARVGERKAGEFLRLVEGLPVPMPPGTDEVTRSVVAGLQARAAAYRAFARKGMLPEVPSMTGILPASVERRIVSPSERRGALAEIPQRPVDLDNPGAAPSASVGATPLAQPGGEGRSLIIGFATTTADLLRAFAAASGRSGAAMTHVIPEIHPIEHPKAGPGFFLALTGIESVGQARTICALMRVRDCEASLAAGARLQEKESRRAAARAPSPAEERVIAGEPVPADVPPEEWVDGTIQSPQEDGPVQSGETLAVPLPPPPKPVAQIGRVELPEGMVVWRVVPAWQEVIRAGRGVEAALSQIEGPSPQDDYERTLAILSEIGIESRGLERVEPATAEVTQTASAGQEAASSAIGTAASSDKTEPAVKPIPESTVASVLGAAASRDQQFDFIKSMQIVGELGVNAYIPTQATDPGDGLAADPAPGEGSPADAPLDPPSSLGVETDDMDTRQGTEPPELGDAWVPEPAIEVGPAPEPQPLIVHPSTDGRAIARLDAEMVVEPEQAHDVEPLFGPAEAGSEPTAKGLRRSDAVSKTAEAARDGGSAAPAVSVSDPIALTAIDPALGSFTAAPESPAPSEIANDADDRVIARVSRHALKSAELARLRAVEREVLAGLDQMLDTERGEGIASGAPAGVFVQLASFRDSAPAQLERDRLSSVLREWMADRPLLEVRRLSGSATYFAVILPGFEGRIDAENFCAAIPSRLTDCWVRGN